MQIHKASEEKLVFNEKGICRIPVLPGVHPGVDMEKVYLKSGEVWEPDVYAFKDKVQVFLFFGEEGFVELRYEAFRITEPAVFIPNFDQSKIRIHAGKKDMSIMHITGEMNDLDVSMIEYIHILLPRFKALKDCSQYTEGFTGDAGSTIESHSVIEHKLFGRYCMGYNVGNGPSFVGQHIHTDMVQYYINMNDSEFVYTAGDEKVKVEPGDVTYTGMGVYHGSEFEEGKKLEYVWFEVATEGFVAY